MKIEADLQVIKRNAEIREEENMAFRRFLKGQDSDRVDRIVHELYEQVLEEVDCTECANCCIELETCFKTDEVKDLTRFLKVDKEEFVKQSMKPGISGDPDELCLNSRPCPFLSGKQCTIYEVRPEECRQYPYLHKDGFIFRLYGVIDNYGICPLVYNVFELLKRRMHFWWRR